MIRIASLDERTTIEILFSGDETFVLSDKDNISTTCSLTRGGRALSVEAVYSRKNLLDFCAELLKMHRELSLGKAASIWSIQGNVAISVVLGERGCVVFKCILAGEGIDKGLFAQAMVDQTYLPEIASQINELSNATTPYSN